MIKFMRRHKGDPERHFACCDRCGRIGHRGFVTVDQARLSARQRGWQIVDRAADLCHECLLDIETRNSEPSDRP